MHQVSFVASLCGTNYTECQAVRSVVDAHILYVYLGTIQCIQVPKHTLYTAHMGADKFIIQ